MILMFSDHLLLFYYQLAATFVLPFLLPMTVFLHFLCCRDRVLYLVNEGCSPFSVLPRPTIEKVEQKPSQRLLLS